MQIFDIIRSNNRYALVIKKERVALRKTLLKCVLIGAGFHHATDEDFVLSADLVDADCLPAESFLELWNDAVFFVQEGRGPVFTKVGELRGKGKAAFVTAYNLFCANERVSDFAPIDLTDRDYRLAFQLNEAMVAVDLSLPAKPLIYQLSQIADWQSHEDQHKAGLIKQKRQLFDPAFSSC